MSSPVVPSTTKALLPTASGTFCQRFKKMISFPTVLHNLVSYLFKESGLPTNEFKTALCDLGCIGSGSGNGGGPPPNENMPAPTLTSASDGSLPTSVDLLWTVVAPPGGTDDLQYKIYRSLGTNTDPEDAVLIATVDHPTVTYNDSTVVVGTIYRYWVQADNGTYTSAFSNSNTGHASAPLLTIPAITDLAATQGFSSGDSAAISLVWTPPAGATKFTIYRNTVNDFATATAIETDMVPEDPENNIIADSSPDQLWNNSGEMVMFHFPPNPTTKYWFWVVSGKDSPPAISDESNPAQGWVRSFYAPFLEASPLVLNRGESATEGVDFDATIARVVLFGGGGGGAGGSQVYGGGGGGGGGIVVEEFAISPGDVLSLVAADNVDNTGNAAALADGLDGPTMTFKINGVDKMITDGGGGGLFDAAGGGAGGIFNSGAGTTAPTIYPGRSGKPGAGSAGGASGYSFGNRRYPHAWFNGFGQWDGNGPSYGASGGGSKAAPGVEVLAVGGFGRVGQAVIVFGT